MRRRRPGPSLPGGNPGRLPRGGATRWKARCSPSFAAWAEALESRVEQDGAGDDLLALWERAFEASKEALDSTPSLLPKLQEAGVVDAGGMGIVVILGGAYHHLNGQDAAQIDLELNTAAGQIDPAQLASVSVESDFLDSSTELEWGYCTQFLIQGEGLDLEQVREDLGQQAESLVIVGDDRVIRVHVHCRGPGRRPELRRGPGRVVSNQD